jgi:hypothetical protein
MSDGQAPAKETKTRHKICHFNTQGGVYFLFDFFKFKTLNATSLETKKKNRRESPKTTTNELEAGSAAGPVSSTCHVFRFDEPVATLPQSPVQASQSDYAHSCLVSESNPNHNYPIEQLQPKYIPRQDPTPAEENPGLEFTVGAELDGLQHLQVQGLGDRDSDSPNNHVHPAPQLEDASNQFQLDFDAGSWSLDYSLQPQVAPPSVPEPIARAQYDVPSSFDDADVGETEEYQAQFYPSIPVEDLWQIVVLHELQTPSSVNNSWSSGMASESTLDNSLYSQSDATVSNGVGPVLYVPNPSSSSGSSDSDERRLTPATEMSEMTLLSPASTNGSPEFGDYFTDALWSDEVLDIS